MENQVIPNLLGVFANSPVERSIVLLAASLENSCTHRTTAHSTAPKAFLHVADEVVCAVNSNQPLTDPNLNSRGKLSHREHLEALTIDSFVASGHKKQQVEVLIGVALEKMSNYLNHISLTELNPACQSEA